MEVDDLDIAEVRNTVADAVPIGRLNEPGSREPEDLLRGLGLLRDIVPFRTTAMLSGNSERLEFELPQCLLRVARFRGLDRGVFLDNRQFMAAHSRCSRMPSPSCPTRLPPRAGSSRAAFSVSTSSSARLSLHGKSPPTLCVTGIMPWAERGNVSPRLLASCSDSRWVGCAPARQPCLYTAHCNTGAEEGLHPSHPDRPAPR